MSGGLNGGGNSTSRINAFTKHEAQPTIPNSLLNASFSSAEYFSAYGGISNAAYTFSGFFCKASAIALQFQETCCDILTHNYFI
jgi:hypothetical protein